MELQIAHSEKLKRQFLELPRRVYASYPCRRDNLGRPAENFLYKKDSYAQACRVEPLLVCHAGEVTARAMLLDDGRQDALRLGFFEALPDRREAVDLLLEYAGEQARKQGAARLLIGLNGHLTYGVGFLRDGFDLPAPFDGVYTAPYYPGYFSNRGLTEHTLSTYYADTAMFDHPEQLRRRAYEGFSYRFINLKDLRREMDILGDLFNKTLAGTRWYSHKTIEESHEMIRAFRPLLRNENIVYALRGGKEIGFVIWHPNFNELITDNGRQSALGFFCKCLLRRGAIREYKINTIGVLPEFANSGAAFGLINEVRKRVDGRLRGGETAFVWDDNLKSSLFCKALCKAVCRRYVAYEMPLHGPA